MLFAGRHLTHKTLQATTGTDYGFIFFFDLEDLTDGDKPRVPTEYVGQPFKALDAEGQVALLQFCENTLPEPDWTYEKDLKKKKLADTVSSPLGTEASAPEE